MAKEVYLGVGNQSRKIKEIYIGVGGQARKVKKAYIGVGGQARLFWEYWPNPTPRFTYTGDWRWYRNDPSLGIIEVYSSGTIELEDSDYVEMDVCLIGGGGQGGECTAHSGSNYSTYSGGGGGAGAYLITVAELTVPSTADIIIGAANGGESSISFTSGGVTQSYSAAGGEEGATAAGKAGSGGTGGGGQYAYRGPNNVLIALNFSAQDGGSNGASVPYEYNETTGTGPYSSSASGTLGGDGDGKTKYLFGDNTYDLYCGGGAGGEGRYSSPRLGGAGGGGNGGGSTSAATAGTKYGAGGGGATYKDGYRARGSGYQGAVFLRFRKNKLVPDTYEQLEYLRASSAGPYIRLPILTQEGLKLEYDCASRGTTSTCYIGYTGTSLQDQFARIFVYKPGAIRYWYGQLDVANQALETSQSLPSSSVDEMNHMVVDFGNYGVNNTMSVRWEDYIGSGTRSNALTAGNPMYLFAWATSRGATTAVGQFGNVLAYNAAGGLIMDLRPVRRVADGVLGFWDVVTQQFLTNIGSGSFTAPA